MADQAVLKYLSIGTTFDPCQLPMDSTFKPPATHYGLPSSWLLWLYCSRTVLNLLGSSLLFAASCWLLLLLFTAVLAVLAVFHRHRYSLYFEPGNFCSCSHCGTFCCTLQSSVFMYVQYSICYCCITQTPYSCSKTLSIVFQIWSFRRIRILRKYFSNLLYRVLQFIFMKLPSVHIYSIHSQNC